MPSTEAELVRRRNWYAKVLLFLDEGHQIRRLHNRRRFYAAVVDFIAHVLPEPKEAERAP